MKGEYVSKTVDLVKNNNFNQFFLIKINIRALLVKEERLNKELKKIRC